MLKYSLLLKCAVVISSHSALAQISVSDDLGNNLVLPHSAQRVIALSPHALDLIYTLGAGSTLVATVDYRDLPAYAQHLPRIGTHAGFDLEQIARLKPDLIIAWSQGGERQLQRLESLGVPIYRSAPTRLEHIGRSLVSLGKLLGHEQEAHNAQQAFQQRLHILRQQYASQRPVRVFFEVWAQPLMTIGGQHTISAALEVCAGRNIFSDLNMPVPAISHEAVLQRHPQVVIVNSPSAQAHTLRETWKPVPVLHIQDQGLGRPAPGILKAVSELCEKIQQLRSSLP